MFFDDAAVDVGVGGPKAFHLRHREIGGEPIADRMFGEIGQSTKRLGRGPVGPVGPVFFFFEANGQWNLAMQI